MMEKIPYSVGNYILPLKCNFGISYGIGQKYLPIWVSVSDLKQDSDFSSKLRYWTKKLTSSKAQWSITRVMKVEKQFEAIKKQKRTNTIQLLYLPLYTLWWPKIQQTKIAVTKI